MTDLPAELRMDYPVSIFLGDDIVYPSAEHAYQAYRGESGWEYRYWVSTLPSEYLPRALELAEESEHPQWAERRLNVLRVVTDAKFASPGPMQDALLKADLTSASGELAYALLAVRSDILDPLTHVITPWPLGDNGFGLFPPSGRLCAPRIFSGKSANGNDPTCPACREKQQELMLLAAKLMRSL